MNVKDCRAFMPVAYTDTLKQTNKPTINSKILYGFYFRAFVLNIHHWALMRIHRKNTVSGLNTRKSNHEHLFTGPLSSFTLASG